MSAGAPPPVGTPAEAPPRRRAHGARTMFSVPFASPMSDGDVARLARTLNLVTHLHPKLHNSPTSPGVVRLASYAAEADVSAPTASNDLRRLLDAGLVVQQGKGRTTRYVASESLRGELRPHLDSGWSAAP
jgi:DNA-binding transcriptional ArsR family regulator